MARVIRLDQPGDERPVNLWGDCKLPPEPPELPDDAEDGEYVPTGRHLCGVGGVPKPDHSRYRCCRCGQWYHYSGSMWYRVSSPPAEWLRAHGLGDDAAAFFDPGPIETGSVFGEFFASRHWMRRLLLILLRRG